MTEQHYIETRNDVPLMSGPPADTLVSCNDCGWQGILEQLYKVYYNIRYSGRFELEKFYECPKCHSESLTKTEREASL